MEEDLHMYMCCVILHLYLCSYIEEDQALQEEMVRLLDRLCQSGGSRLLARSTTVKSS